MSRRWKWTRKRYERARRLSRLLANLRELPDAPALVERYFDLMRPLAEQHDPMDQTSWGYRDLRHRLRVFKGDDIPF